VSNRFHVFYAVMEGGSVATISEVIGEIKKAAGASERLMEFIANATSTVQTQAKHWLISNKVREN